MALPAIDVAVAVVRDAHGRVLLAERTARQVAGGFWEAPGGKIDPGETAPYAAARELAEETGLEADALRHWMTYEHAFRTRRVRLHIFHAERWRGTPRGREGQRLAWVDPAAPTVAPLLPSNDRLMRALSLPPVIALIDAPGIGIAGAVARDAGLIIARAPMLPPDQRVAFVRRVIQGTQTSGARVLLAGSTLEAGRAGADGVHSDVPALRRLAARPAAALWCAACEDAADVARAAALGADAIMIGPIRGAPALGWDRLGALAGRAPMAVYAWGGLTPGCLTRAREHGAHGIALETVDLKETV